MAHLELYDASFAKKQQSTHGHGVALYVDAPRQRPPPLSPELQQKLLDALAKEAHKVRKREDERRRRDPTYRPDAVELSYKTLKDYDKYVDYYAVLGVDEFASLNDLKAAFKQRSLQLHPDKQANASAREAEAAQTQYFAVSEAYDILSDLPTRRQYDLARDKVSATTEAGLADVGRLNKPPPSCVDVDVTLEQLYRGVRMQVSYARWSFVGTQYEKREKAEIYSIKVNRGEVSGATFWHRNMGDVGVNGRADLIFILRQSEHPRYERVGDDLWMPYADAEPLPPQQLFFGALVRSIDGRVALARGNSLAAWLGFDRSGVGEARVSERGMPLRDSPAKGFCTRGDLVVKFPIAAPAVKSSADRPRRVAAGAQGVVCPPVALLTTSQSIGLAQGGAGAAAGSSRCPVDGSEALLLPHLALKLLVEKTVVPHLARFMLSRRAARERDACARAVRSGIFLEALSEARRHPSAAAEVLTVVHLQVGGHAAPASPSCAVRQIQHAISQAAPFLRWRSLHMAAGVAAPLLPDEEMALTSAPIVIVEALEDVKSASGPPPPDAGASPRAWLARGARAAERLMLHPAAQALHDAHCAGATILALDLGCVMLGHVAVDPQAVEPLEAAAAEAATDVAELLAARAAGAASSRAAPLTAARIEEIQFECLADDVPFDTESMRGWSEQMVFDYFESGGLAPMNTSLGTRPGEEAGVMCADVRHAIAHRPAALRLGLPFHIGLSTPAAATTAGAAGVDDGRAGEVAAMQPENELSALHRAALRSELEDCAQGFCALELPEACVLVCRLDERFQTRPVLGSSTPTRLSRARVLEDEATLTRMRSALEAERALKRANLAPRDVQALRKVCAECGCAAALHEKLREKMVPDDEF